MQVTLCNDLTYALSGEGGLYHDRLIEILENKGFKRVPIGTPMVNFVWGELDYVKRPKTYEPEFKTQSADLKSVLGGNISNITDKTNLYYTIRNGYPEYLNHLPQTRLINNITSVKNGEILIARPKGGFQRRGVEIITSSHDLENYKRKYGSNVVVSDYILNPMLLNGTKFHLRVHILVYVNNGYSRGYMLNRIPIMTAGNLYERGQWNNKTIHLTGSEYTEDFYLWPSSFVGSISPNILDIANESLQHLVVGIINAIGNNSSSYEESDSAFEIFCADVMFQDNGHAILIEVNKQVGYSPLPFELQNNVHSIFSSEYFEWVANSCVLPHFGMQIIPEPLWSGNSLTSGSLSPYIELLSSPNLLSLLPLDMVSDTYIPNLSAINPNIDFVALKVKSAEYSVGPCRNYYYWTIILRSHIVGYLSITPSFDSNYLQLQWGIHPSVASYNILQPAISLCFEIVKALSFPSMTRLLSYVHVSDSRSLEIVESLNFKKSLVNQVPNNEFTEFYYDIVSPVATDVNVKVISGSVEIAPVKPPIQRTPGILSVTTVPRSPVASRVPTVPITIPITPKSPSIPTRTPAVPIAIPITPKSPIIPTRTPAVPIAIPITPKSPSIPTRTLAVPIAIPITPKSPSIPTRTPAVPITIPITPKSPSIPTRTPVVPITIPSTSSNIPRAPISKPIRAPIVNIPPRPTPTLNIKQVTLPVMSQHITTTPNLQIKRAVPVLTPNPIIGTTTTHIQNPISQGMNIWRTEMIDMLDISILPDQITLIRDGYNHFICICGRDEVNPIIEKYGDDVKLLVLTEQYDWELEYKTIVCYSKERVYSYINKPIDDVEGTKKRYTFMGSRGLRKYWLHIKLRSWSFVREQPSVDYYRFEYTGIKELDNKSYTVKATLKTPLDTKSLRNVSKDVIANIGNFVPRSYNINRFRPRKNEVYILKPVASSGGEGITVFSTEHDFSLAKKKLGVRAGIISEYINNPKLFNGRKFHFRCYFMVTTWGKFYLYPIFKIITAKLPYYKGDYLNSDIHDTHIKTTPRNMFYPDDLPGTNYLTQIQNICDILGNVIKPYGYDEAYRSYEILGLDILIDTNDKAWLLEVNATPGMHPVNDDYSDYDVFEKGILEWEYQHAINTSYDPHILGNRNIPQCYLFSGKSGFITDFLKHFLTAYGVKPSGSGVLLRDTPRAEVPKNVKFLFVETLSNTEGFDGKTYTIKTDVHNLLETNSKRNLVSKSYLHELMKGSKFIAETADLFEFNYQGGVYIIRPCGIIFCSGKDITIISTKEEFDAALIYYSNLLKEAAVNPNKALRAVRIIISEYFDNPLLFDNPAERKFHLRLYLLVVSPIGNVPFKCKIARDFGKILTAEKAYVSGDYFNKEIHDSHVGSTPRSIFFPNEFPQQNMLPYINEQLNDLEVELVNICFNMIPFPDQAKSAYEIFGLDILVLRNGQIKLLEVNDRVGYNDRDPTLQSVQNFMFLHSLWQWNEAIHPLLQATAS